MFSHWESLSGPRRQFGVARVLDRDLVFHGVAHFGGQFRRRVSRFRLQPLFLDHVEVRDFDRHFNMIRRFFRRFADSEIDREFLYGFSSVSARHVFTRERLRFRQLSSLTGRRADVLEHFASSSDREFQRRVPRVLDRDLIFDLLPRPCAVSFARRVRRLRLRSSVPSRCEVRFVGTLTSTLATSLDGFSCSFGIAAATLCRSGRRLRLACVRTCRPATRPARLRPQPLGAMFVAVRVAQRLRGSVRVARVLDRDLVVHGLPDLGRQLALGVGGFAFDLLFLFDREVRVRPALRLRPCSIPSAVRCCSRSSRR